jgi:hypothetical protein
MQQVKLHRGQAELSAIFANKRVGIEIEQPVQEPKGIAGASGRALSASASARVAPPFDFRALVESWSFNAMSPDGAIV